MPVEDVYMFLDYSAAKGKAEEAEMKWKEQKRNNK